MSFAVYTERGKQLILASEIGSGGEGTIYASPLDKSECAKVYSKPLSKEYERKLELMVQNPPHDPSYDTRKHHSIAWPSALLFKDVGCSQLIGFLMPAVDTKIFRKVMSYVDPEERRRLFGGGFNWKYLYTAGFNIVSCIAAIHGKGYCIGDINESNILVARNALVTLIDCDSFQVPDNTSGKIFRCLVGKDEYRAPELHINGNTDRTPESDCFALAVVLFQLLMEGTHPYQAKGKLVEDATSTQAKIVKGYFPYTMEGREIAPPDHAPPFGILHPEIQSLFYRCFVRGHRDPSARPMATEWFSAFRKLGSRFKQCAANENHLFLDHLSICPWCELAKSAGKDPFPSPVGQQIGLDDPGLIRDSLDKRLDYFNTYVAMALADGLLTTEEESQLHAYGAKLQIPPKEIERAIQVEVKKVSGRISSSGGGTPKLEISKSVFGFQNIRAGSTAQESFVMSNTGGGILQGSIKSTRPWLKPSQGAIDPTHHRQNISFVIDTTGLPLGLKEQGQIEINSNGGTQTIIVEISVEVPDVAMGRFRKALFWVGFCGGGLFGFLLYQLLSNVSSRDFITGLAGFVGVGAAVVAGSRAKGFVGGGFAGGCGALILGSITLGILSAYWPEGFSTFSWAITYGAFIYLTSRAIFVAKQTKRKTPILAVAFGAAALSVMVIVGGVYLGKAAEGHREAQRAASLRILHSLAGTWHGSLANDRATLVIAQSAQSDQLRGHIDYTGVREELAVEVRNDGVIVLTGSSYRRLSGSGGFSLDTFYARISSDGKSMNGSYKDQAGHQGEWTMSRTTDAERATTERQGVGPVPSTSSSSSAVYPEEGLKKPSATSSEAMVSSVSEGQFTLEAPGCQMSGGVLMCRLLITNHGGDSEFHLNAICGSGPSSKVVDLDGHEFVASKSQLGSRLSQRPGSCEWVGDAIRQGVPEMGILTFRDVPADFSGVGALVVGFWAGTNHSVTIRNVPFSRQETTSSSSTRQGQEPTYTNAPQSPGFSQQPLEHPLPSSSSPQNATPNWPTQNAPVYTSRPIAPHWVAPSAPTHTSPSASPLWEPRNAPTKTSQEAPTSYSGPESGIISWTGEVGADGEVVIQNGSSNVGSVQGSLPHVECQIEVVSSTKPVSIVEPPMPSNNYSHITVRIKGKGHQSFLLRWTVIRPAINR